jgi:hypothetical protein
MAEPKSQKKRTTRAASSRAAHANGASSRRLSAGDAIERVREELPNLLGAPVESILGVERDDGGWKVSAQIVELSRIPYTMDVLGVYAVSLDSDGQLEGYRRERRYSRGQVIED